MVLRGALWLASRYVAVGAVIGRVSKGPRCALALWGKQVRIDRIRADLAIRL